MNTGNIRDGPGQRLVRWKDMNVFLSWSGEESKAVAQALYFWLPEVIQTVRPWMSQQDLVAGVRWSNEIEGNLKQSAFGIICVTPSNRSAPWLNFEAGAISNNLGVVNVVPYIFRLGFADLSGPLTQFQGKEATREGTRDVVGALNKSLGEAGLDGRRLEKAFEKLWPDLEEKLKAIPQTPESKASEEEAKGRTEEDKLDEMLLLLRRVASNPTEKLTNRLSASQKALKERSYDLANRKSDDKISQYRIYFHETYDVEKLMSSLSSLGVIQGSQAISVGGKTFFDVWVRSDMEKVMDALGKSNEGIRAIDYMG